jgi:hypothetical protein
MVPGRTVPEVCEELRSPRRAPDTLVVTVGSTGRSPLVSPDRPMMAVLGDYSIGTTGRAFASSWCRYSLMPYPVRPS